jgi:folylpolyglutamate synthase/dihydrofolate synthase
MPTTSIARSELDLGLSRVYRVLDHLDHPERSFSAIHVAGTNGKGSVCAILESCLRSSVAMGRVGRFVSPFLVEPRDAVWIDGKPVDVDVWESTLTKVLSASSTAYSDKKEEKSLTTFELWTITAFQCFRDASVKIAVIEVGVGGRDDATNVIPTPLVAVITSISMDHVELLGPSIASIAGHKSGIIKAPTSDSTSAIVVTSPDQHDDVLNVIQQRSIQVGARLVIATSLVRSASVSYPEERAGENYPEYLYEVRNDGNVFKVPMVLLGEFQRMNGGTALATLREMQKLFPGLSDQDIVTGFSRVTWSGRMQRILVSPPFSLLSNHLSPILSQMKPLEFILDGGHNEGAIPLVRATIDELIRSSSASKRVQFIFSSGASRSLSSLLPHLLRPGDTLLAVPFSPPEGMGWVKSHSPEAIVSAVQTLFGDGNIASTSPPVQAITCSSLNEALEKVFVEAYEGQSGQQASDVSLRVICGSLYLVSDVLRREESYKKLIQN